MTSAATPLWFGPADRPLFGWVHQPADGRARGAVVVCPPIGREHSSSYFALRKLAESLAAQGLVAVRFDYDGTGDSSGYDDDPDRVAALLAGIGHAVELARRTGSPTVSLVGLRLGALFAAVAAGRLGGIDQLVLWDACPSGRAWVKEQRALQLLHFGAAGERPGVEVPGFVLSEQTVADLRELQPEVAGDRAPRRALVLSRPGTTTGLGLAESLGVSEVDTGEASEQEAFLDIDPRLLRLPAATIERIARWLSEGTTGELVPVGVDGPSAATVAGPGGVGVRETATRLGPLGLFGIESALARPTGGSRCGPVILLLTTANEPHAGPNRLWVRLAREWAARGMTSVRFDLSGLGDSPVRPGQAEHVVRAPQSFDDVADVAAAVSPDDPGAVVLVGLCSGGYQALESALALTPRGVCSVNPVIHFAPPEAADGRVDPRRRICRPTSTAARVYRAVPLGEFGRHGRALAWRLVNRFGRHSPASWLSELVDAGVDVLCVGGEDETRPLREGDGKVLARLLASGRLRIDVVPGLDHALLAAEQREEVVRSLIDHVVEQFGSTSVGLAMNR